MSHVGDGTQVIWQRDDALVGVAHDLVVVRWTGVPTSPQLAALGAAHDVASRVTHRVRLLDVIAGLQGPTHVDARLHTEIVALITRCRGRTHAVAHAVEVPGAPGAIVRAFLGALERVAGDGRTRVATFDASERAAAWLERAGAAREVMACTVSSRPASSREGALAA